MKAAMEWRCPFCGVLYLEPETGYDICSFCVVKIYGGIPGYISREKKLLAMADTELKKRHYNFEEYERS